MDKHDFGIGKSYSVSSNVVSQVASNHHVLSMRKEHRDFISAIFDVGLKAASPASVMAQMNPGAKTTFDGLNLERIKSKLQKFRKKKECHKEEFLALYDKTISKFNHEVFPIGDREQKSKLADRLRLLPPIEKLSSAEIAAFLSYTVMVNSELNENSLYNFDGTGELEIPELTEAEMKLPIGMAFKSFLRLFLCLEKDLKLSRSSSAGQAVTKNEDSVLITQNSLLYSLPIQRRMMATMSSDPMYQHHDIDSYGYSHSLPLPNNRNMEATMSSHPIHQYHDNNNYGYMRSYSLPENSMGQQYPLLNYRSMDPNIPPAHVVHHRSNSSSLPNYGGIETNHFPTVSTDKRRDSKIGFSLSLSTNEHDCEGYRNKRRDSKIGFSLSLSSSEHDYEGYQNILKNNSNLDINDSNHHLAHQQATSNLQMLSSVLSSREEEEDRMNNQKPSKQKMLNGERKRKRKNDK